VLIVLVFVKFGHRCGSVQGRRPQGSRSPSTPRTSSENTTWERTKLESGAAVEREKSCTAAGSRISLSPRLFKHRLKAAS
jgi:hypothetical protein